MHNLGSIEAKDSKGKGVEMDDEHALTLEKLHEGWWVAEWLPAVKKGGNSNGVRQKLKLVFSVKEKGVFEVPLMAKFYRNLATKGRRTWSGSTSWSTRPSRTATTRTGRSSSSPSTWSTSGSRPTRPSRTSCDQGRDGADGVVGGWVASFCPVCSREEGRVKLQTRDRVVPRRRLLRLQTI